ncbi:MAG: pitrilysin family protein [Pseudomonadota bacterium]|jgi:zinc protease
MSTLSRALCVGAALLALCAAVPVGAAEPGVPPIPYQSRTLANGLTVYWAVDKTTPNVTVQVWYDVGGKDDPPGRSGFAHLFEHLMFKGTKDMPAEFMDRLTEDVGGFNNASTAEDYTNFYEVIPANHLQSLIWAEAERMGALVVDRANFASERSVVKEELRLRVLASPYGRLFNYDLPEASFMAHPYKRAPIGSIADLDAATLTDVRAFHATYYRPDNAALLVIGNFDPAQLNAWVDQYFSGLARPAVPIPRVTAVEPARTGAKDVTTYGPNVPLPAVIMTFPAPAAADSDAPALQVASAILSSGKSSRLYHDLVYQQQLAADMVGEFDARQQPGLFIAGAILASGKTPDQGEAALLDELKRLRETPVSAAELARARNQLRASALGERETIEGRAFELGRAILLEGDAARANTDLDRLAQVSAADVQRVAIKYLDPAKRVTVRYLQQTATARDASGEPAAKSAATPVESAATKPTQAAPPPPGAPVAVVLPKAAERTLPNGLRVIVAKTSDLPLVSAQVLIRRGAASDPPGLAGLASFTADLLPQGTATRSASQIAEEIEALGGAIGASAGYDASAVSLTVLADQLPKALPILADVVRHPAFAQDEIDRLRQQDLDAITVGRKEPGALAGMAVPAVVFGAGPYGHPSDGTEQSLKRIDRAAISRQYQALYRPDDAVVVLTGDITPDEGFALAQQAFGDWKAPATLLTPPPAQGKPPAPRVVVIDLPGTGQAAVTLAGPAIQRKSPDYYSGALASAVLGGGYSARLNEEVRVRRGLSYGASASLDARREGGLFVARAQTKNQSADEVARLMLNLEETLATAPLPADELTARKATLVGEYGRSAATSAGLADVLGRYATVGVDLGEVQSFTGKLEAVSAAQTKAAASKIADPSRTSLIIAGDAKLFLPELKKRYPNLVVIPAAKLDPGRPDLGAGK